MVQLNPVQTDTEGAIEGVRIKGVSAPGGGVLRISSDRDDQRFLGGLKSSISGFFWGGGKFWQTYFLG